MAKIVIDQEKCKGCLLCVRACPRKCVKAAEDFNKAGYHPAAFSNDKNCTGCGFCYLVCPDVCIEVYK